MNKFEHFQAFWTLYNIKKLFRPRNTDEGSPNRSHQMTL